MQNVSSDITACRESRRSKRDSWVKISFVISFTRLGSRKMFLELSSAAFTSSRYLSINSPIALSWEYSKITRLIIKWRQYVLNLDMKLFIRARVDLYSCGFPICPIQSNSFFTNSLEVNRSYPKYSKGTCRTSNFYSSKCSKQW